MIKAENKGIYLCSTYIHNYREKGCYNIKQKLCYKVHKVYNNGSIPHHLPDDICTNLSDALLS